MVTHLYQLIQQRAARWPTLTALGGQQGLTWKTLDGAHLRDLVDRLAGELAACGVGVGDRVVLWLPNGWRTPVYLFALWKLGAVVVPFDREMNPTAAASIIETVEARLVLVGSGERPPWSLQHAVTEWWEPGSRGGEPAPGDWSPPAEDLATLSFTSGTTGHPKGCMITHANLCFEIEALRAIIPLDSACRLASILPLSHLYELTCGLLYPMAAGAAVHYIPSRRPPDILRVLAEQRVTHMVVVPQLLTLMGKALDDGLRERLPGPAYAGMRTLAAHLPMSLRRRLYWPIHRRLGGHLRLLASGGAALAPETHHLWERMGVRVVQGYGTSETAPVVAGANADGSTPVGSVGRPLPGVMVRLSEEGEVLVRGPNVMRGYWRDPARTAEVLRDGWYTTGDTATIDARGNLRVIGRTKELIVLPSGLKVWPRDVEAVLEEHPAVGEAAVVGVATPTGGMVLHAFLRAARPDDPPADLHRLLALCNARLAQHQRVASGSWWAGDFPRTAIGKVRRHLLTPPPSDQVVSVQAALADDDPVGQTIAGIARVSLGPADQTLGELGLDSLGLVDLALALEEKTDKRIDDGDLRLEMTVARVRELVLAAPERVVEADDRPPPAARGPRDRPDWPYLHGRWLRWLRFPIDLLYRAVVTRTTVLGAEHLSDLPIRCILAGTHRSFPDVPLVYHALARSPARRLVNRLVVPTRAAGILRFRVYGWWGTLAYGLYPVNDLGVASPGLRRLAHLAERGNAILIFPQGRHLLPEMERAGAPEATFRHGAALLAEALGAPVVPFGLAGSEQLVPRDLDAFTGRVVAGIPLALRRGPLAIAFGPAMRPRPGEDVGAFTERLQAACFALARRAEASLG